MSAARRMNLAGPSAVVAGPIPGPAGGDGGRRRRGTPRLPAARRDERAMTTLEWLMIVGAVAGLAALAVVLVAGLVDDSAEGVAGGGATTNRSAAEAAASQVMEEARRPGGSGEGFDTWGEWSRYYTARCSRLAVLYSTIGIDMNAEFNSPKGRLGDKPKPEELRDAGTAPPTSENQKAQILCEVAG